MTLLSLGCEPLDALLGGGIESGIITRIYGEAGTGKTNFAFRQFDNVCVPIKRSPILTQKEFL
jgi:DNA repair protein RadB